MIKKKCIGLHLKNPLFLSDLMKLEFSQWILEKYSNINLIKIRPVGAELFHADGRADRHDEAKSRFLQLCERA